MSTFLVTGGAGFIGSNLAEALLAQGDTVRVLDDFSSGRRSNLEGLRGKLDVIEGTIVDEAAVRRAMQGVEVVFHHAAIASVPRSVDEPQTAMLVNVQGTTVVLDVAHRAGARRVVFAASSAAYGNDPEVPKVETMLPQPESPYAVSKVSGEQLMTCFARIHGLETVSLRYFNIFGPRQDPTSQYAAVIPNFVAAALGGKKPTVFGDGEQTRDFCFIENVVRANILAATTPKKLRGEVVNIACAERISLNQLLAMIGEEVGRAVEATYGPARAGDVRDSLASIAAARALLGYEPTIKVREGLKRTIAAMRAH